MPRRLRWKHRLILLPGICCVAWFVIRAKPYYRSPTVRYEEVPAGISDGGLNDKDSAALKAAIESLDATVFAPLPLGHWSRWFDDMQQAPVAINRVVIMSDPKTKRYLVQVCKEAPSIDASGMYWVTSGADGKWLAHRTWLCNPR